MQSQDPPNYYDELGVGRSVSNEELSKAYKDLVVRYHPDRHQGNDLEALAREKLKRINEAYEVLSDPDKRRAYDATIGWTGAFRRARANPGSFKRKSLLSKVITLGIALACLPVLMRNLRGPKQAAISLGVLLALFYLPRLLSRLRKK